MNEKIFRNTEIKEFQKEDRMLKRIVKFMKRCKRKVKHIFIITILILTFGLATGCGTISSGEADVTEIKDAEETTNKGDLEVQEEKVIYEQITAREAKEIMEQKTGYLILDVRTEEEYAAGHIENAMLIPDYEIEARAETELTDKEQMILVYCRSGRRSKGAAEKLASMGYCNVKEFGGIIDWSYGVVTE